MFFQHVHDDTFKFVEVRGKVIGEIKGEEAFDNIQALSNKYWNKPYPFPVQTERIVLKIPKILAPKKIAVLPLLKKDGLPELSKKIKEEFKWEFNTIYDEKDAIGRRYRRQDALGTPYCLTVDHQSLEDGTITIRDRDSMKQERMSVEEIKLKIRAELDIKSWLNS